MASGTHDVTPAWTWIAPVAASLLLGAKFAGLIPDSAALTLVAAAVLLLATVFAAVHHAEILALRLGEPFGSILLALAVTVIEVALIVSIMLSGAPGSDAVARDTVFATLMIVLNGVIGLSLVLGGHRHHEQSFQLQGAAAALAVLGTLAVITIVLPNFTRAPVGPYYGTIELLFVGAVSMVLYATFVFVQTIRHRDYFLEGPRDGDAPGPATKPPNGVTLASAVLLPVALTAVVLLAKLLSVPLDQAIASAGLPKSFVGVVIAAIVLLPEGIASVRAAAANRLQNSINLAVGSAIASIGLTIPTVAVVALLTSKTIVLGITPPDIVLLVLTLFVSSLTLGTGRTTVLQGVVHLVIFGVFILLAAS